MTGSSILISLNDLSSFTPQFRAELRDYAFKTMADIPAASAAEAPAESEDEEGELAVLGLRQARRLVEGCSPKTRSVLEEVVKHEGKFALPALAARFNTGPGGLGGVWGGLTKRVRTVTGDGEALLIGWSWENDEWHGALDPLTLASLRKALDSK